MKKTPAPQLPTQMEFLDASGVQKGLTYYRGQNSRLITAILILTCIAMASMTLNGVLLLTRPEPRYFASSPDMRLAPMIPLAEPLMDDTGLRNWVADAVTRTMSLNFNLYARQLEDISDCYTPEAFKQVKASLIPNIEYIVANYITIVAVLSKPPLIINRGLLQGKYTWQIQFPMRLAFESGKGLQQNQEIMATVLVQRVDTASNPRGVAISQLVLK